jgi:hypothetical protein
MQRAVRQRVGFGCVMCGSPIYDYEHVHGYTVTGHVEDAITLLCPMHHREKTAGRLPVSIVEDANARPHNLHHRIGGANPLYFGPEIKIVFGNFVCEPKPGRSTGLGVSVDGDFLIGVSAQPVLELSLDIRDSSNRPLLVVRKGRLRHATRAWDVQYVGTTLTIREGLRKVVLQVEFAAPSMVIVHTADLWLHHVNFKVGKVGFAGGLEEASSGFFLANHTLVGSTVSVGPPPLGAQAAFRFDDVRRGYGAPAARFDSPFRADTAKEAAVKALAALSA